MRWLVTGIDLLSYGHRVPGIRHQVKTLAGSVLAILYAYAFLWIIGVRDQNLLLINFVWLIVACVALLLTLAIVASKSDLLSRPRFDSNNRVVHFRDRRIPFDDLEVGTSHYELSGCDYSRGWPGTTTYEVYVRTSERERFVLAQFGSEVGASAYADRQRRRLSRGAQIDDL